MSSRLATPRALTNLTLNARLISKCPSSSRTLTTKVPNCLRERREQVWAAAGKDEVRRCPRRLRRDFHSSSSALSVKDPYKALGVAKDASLAEIKKSYYALARKYHPDTNKEKDAQEKFVEIQAAYDTLSDTDKRAAYDQYGAASQQPGFDPNAFAGAGFGGAGFGGFRDFGAAFRAGPGSAGADIFEQLFGTSFGGRAQTRASNVNNRGDDLDARVGVSFLEAAKGAKRTLNVTPIAECSTCSGSGMKAGAKKTTCTSCGGSGTRTFVLQQGFHMAETCDACEGSGHEVPRGSQCGDCNGRGKVRVRKAVTFTIPAGVEDGMMLRVPNEGDAPASGKGPKGDLLVRINVASSKVFRRQGINIHHEARIPMHTALLGGRVRVPTLDGEVDVRVPGGTQQGEEMVLKGRGMPRIYGSGDKGDLFVSFAIQLPRSLTKRQRGLLQAYADDVEGRSSKSGSSSSLDGPGESPGHATNSTGEEGPTAHDTNDSPDSRRARDDKEPERRTATG